MELLKAWGCLFVYLFRDTRAAFLLVLGTARSQAPVLSSVSFFMPWCLFSPHGAPSFRIVLWRLSEGILLGFLLLQQPGQAVRCVPCLLNNFSQN